MIDLEGWRAVFGERAYTLRARPMQPSSAGPLSQGSAAVSFDFHPQFASHSEMYFGTGEAVQDRLAAAKQDARRSRLEVNRAEHCAVCA